LTGGGIQDLQPFVRKYLRFVGKASVLLKLVAYSAGAVIAYVNILPIPWSARLSWARFLYRVSIKTTGYLPWVWRFVESQNVAYEMGKRERSYQPILQLQKVLEYSSVSNISAERMKAVVVQAESEEIAESDLGHFIANRLFCEETAKRVLKISPKDSQTW